MSEETSGVTETAKPKRTRNVKPILAIEVVDGRWTPVAGWPEKVTSVDRAVKEAAAIQKAAADAGNEPEDIVLLRVLGSVTSRVQKVTKTKFV